MRISPTSIHSTAANRTCQNAPAAAANTPAAKGALGFPGTSSFELETKRLAAHQPGSRAWAAPHNKALPLCVEDDGSFLGALGQPLPSTLDIDQIAGVLPSDGSRPDGRTVFVNGLASTRGKVAEQMQMIADMTGTEVVGLYNATDGVLKDVLQTIGDRLDVGQNAAVNSLTRLILSKIDDCEPLRLAAYSQGALITSRALEDVRQALMARGLSAKQAEAKLSSIEVETFGGAASHYPDGPEYVHHINRWDPVSLLSFYALGHQGNPLVDPGRGAKVNVFSPSPSACSRRTRWGPTSATTRRCSTDRPILNGSAALRAGRRQSGRAP